MFEGILQKFADRAPAAVMARLILGRAVNAQILDELFDRTAQRQYSRDLLFSSLCHLMLLVVFRVNRSIHSAYQEQRDQIEVSLTSVYNKLNGVDVEVSRALVRETAHEIGQQIETLGGSCQAWLNGYRIKILDGNCIEASDHRLKVLRPVRGGALPGKSLVVYDPRLEMVVDVFPCENGHAQERSLLGEVIETVEPGEVWIADRNFCTRHFLASLAERGAYGIIREHEKLPFTPRGAMIPKGRSETGEVSEQEIEVPLEEGRSLTLRRIGVKLDKPTRDGEDRIYILTNLPAEAADALLIAQIYRKRWKIETAFQELESHLHSEINSLGYPKAALFSFCMALVAYNALAVIKAAIRAEHGERKVAEEVSAYHLTQSVVRATEGLMIAVDESQWKHFEQISVIEFTKVLRDLVRRMDLRRYKKAKSRPTKPKRKKADYDYYQPHVATAKLLC